MFISMQSPISSVRFTGKSIYLDNADIVTDNPFPSMVDQDHMNKAWLLGAVKQFNSPIKHIINQGFTTIKPDIQNVYTVIAPEIGPNSDKLIISELETDEDSINTKIHELDADDFKDTPEYLRIFYSLKDAIIQALNK